MTRHRRTYKASHVGRLRIRAAQLLSKGLGRPVQPEDISIATGAYRTDWRQDVYRWELFLSQDNYGIGITAGCWMTLTEFVKLAAKEGCHIDEYREIRTGKRD